MIERRQTLSFARQKKKTPRGAGVVRVIAFGLCMGCTLLVSLWAISAGSLVGTAYAFGLIQGAGWCSLLLGGGLGLRS